MIVPDNIENILNQKVLQGLYDSKESAIEEAVKLLDKKDKYINYINSAIQEGMASIKNGNVYSAEQVESELDKLKNS